MSNLKSSFDIVRGWPKGSAVDENFGYASGLTVTEGTMVVVDGSVTTAQNIKLPSGSIPLQTAAVPTKYRMVIQGNDQKDANFVGKVTTLRGSFTVVTANFVAGAYVPGSQVCVHHAVDANQGFLQLTTGTEQVVGEVEAYDSVNGLLTVAMSI